MAEGRLADPDRSMATDPRSDPRMVAALAQFGLEANMPVVPLTIDVPLQERLAYAEMCEAGIGVRPASDRGILTFSTGAANTRC
jgi:acetyl esterase